MYRSCSPARRNPGRRAVADSADAHARQIDCARQQLKTRMWETRAILARETGLEPATSGVTGRRSNQLSYSPANRTATRCSGVAR